MFSEMKAREIFMILVCLSLIMISPKDLHAEQRVKIANLDNFVLQKHLTKQRVYENTLEKDLENVVEYSFFGIGRGNKTKIEKFSLVNKVIRDPGGTYELDSLGENSKPY